MKFKLECSGCRTTKTVLDNSMVIKMSGAQLSHAAKEAGWEESKIGWTCPYCLGKTEGLNRQLFPVKVGA